jgi:nucleotide-binding universal stress UspA family protein
MYRSILVPLDGSTFAEHALPYALAIARRSGAQVRLVTVSTPLAEAYVEGLYFSAVELEQEITQRHRTYLEATAKRLREKTEVAVSLEVKHGEVAPTLAEMVARGEADLVVLATHGRGAIGRFWLGSVADEMVRQTNAPLLLVRPTAGNADLGSEPDLGRIVLPLDGSEHAEQILEHAVRVAKLQPGAEIILVRAIHAVLSTEETPDVPPAEREARSLLHQVESLQTKLSGDAEVYLKDIARKLEGRGVKARIHVLVEDEPAAAILHEAEAQRAGLIAMETHGRSGLSRLVRGSVTDKVIRGSHIPVLIHRPISG